MSFFRQYVVLYIEGLPHCVSGGIIDEFSSVSSGNYGCVVLGAPETGCVCRASL